jgi:phosphonate metabolism protein PhnN/1,5-bisphosphokinase (PRPP-forming)
VFARRTITRPADSSEESEYIDADAFWHAAAAGEFAMQWQANDLCYGIRRGVEAHLLAGRDVIVNGSREYITQLRRAYPTAQVIWIEAGVEQIRRRLVDRRRESGPALLRRLERVTQFSPVGDDVVRIDNNGTVEQAGQQLLMALSRTGRK